VKNHRKLFSHSPKARENNNKNNNRASSQTTEEFFREECFPLWDQETRNLRKRRISFHSANIFKALFSFIYIIIDLRLNNLTYNKQVTLVGPVQTLYETFHVDFRGQ